MFKLLHFIIFVSFALLLSACGSLTTRHASTYIAATPVVSAPVFPVEAVIDFPPMEVKELPIPVVPLHERARVVMSEAEVECMARNIYFESKGESDVGQAAVGYVVLNRVKDRRFPSTICGVIAQKYKGVCQFSWRCDGRSDVPSNRTAYERARQIARDVMEGNLENPIGDSLFFHGIHIRKGKRYAVEYRIGGHRFYGSSPVSVARL